MNPKFPLQTWITDVSFSGMQYAISWWVNSVAPLSQFITNNLFLFLSKPLIYEFTSVWVLPSTLCLLCWRLSKSLWTNVLFQWSLPYVYHLWLVISLFLKFCIFPKYCKYVVVPGVSYGTWYSVTLFANGHNCAISLRLRKETSCLSNLDGAVLKKFWFQI